jgi:glycosyltransferase involved in cell wall biosynthesis
LSAAREEKTSSDRRRVVVRILILAWQAPATSSLPGSPRLFSLSRELCSDHELELLVMPQDPERMASFRDDPDASRVYSRIDELPQPPVPSWIQKQMHRVRREPSFSLRALAPRYHAEICAEVRGRCAAADFLLVDGIAATQYVRDVSIPAAADLHDSVSLLIWRSAERAESLLERGLLRIESRVIAGWERGLRNHFGLVITNSDVDRDEIRRLDSRSNVITIPNGVDTAYFSPGSEARARARLVFTGVMGYGPNDDAARFFSQEVLPHIREHEPESEFWVVGHEPRDSLLALDGKGGVRVTGSVPDVRPYVREATAFVCPLRYGTGMKNKILAAMAMRRPVVATSISLDGIYAVPEEHVLVGDSPEELARQSLRLIRDDKLVERLCDSAQAWVEENFSWSERADSLRTELEKLCASPSVV